jgi:hypothetical protein
MNFGKGDFKVMPLCENMGRETLSATSPSPLLFLWHKYRFIQASQMLWMYSISAYGETSSSRYIRFLLEKR